MNINDFISLTKMSQSETKSYLTKRLSDFNYEPISRDGFLFVRGATPVLLVAHMDTTPTVDGMAKRNPVTDFNQTIENGNHVISSPQGIGGDDRCGIYTILKVLERSTFRPYILFCEDEEVGCIGTEKFCKTQYINEIADTCNFIVEIDRRGSHDLVFYEDANSDWHDWCEKITGWKENWGSCSDISYLAPETGVAAVNISSGYYNEHTTKEYVVCEEVEDTIECVMKLLMASEGNVFKFEEQTWERQGDMGIFSNGYGPSYLWIEFEDDKTDPDNPKILEEVISCTNPDEGFGVFLQMYPYICFDDVLDYEMCY